MCFIIWNIVVATLLFTLVSSSFHNFGRPLAGYIKKNSHKRLREDLVMKRCVASLLLLCGILFFVHGQVFADEYVFKYANTQSDTHPRSKSMMLFKEKLEAATDGRIKVELYLSGVLGKEAEVLDMVKIGTVQGCRGGLFERANRKYLLYTLPFMFENTDQVLKLMASEFGDKVNEDALKNGFYIPATGAAGGFRNITNNLRPIETVEDLKGSIEIIVFA